MIEPVGKCRVCGSTNLEFLFSLGNHYVNDFVEPGKEHSGIQCPISLELCRDCTLVQLQHTAPQDFLYSRHYWYKSGVNEAMRDALFEAANTVTKTALHLQPGDVVLDIGSNDGTMLRYFNPQLVTVGVEPATNLAEEGADGIHFFINDFWSAESYFKAVKKKAKIVTAFGMFYDLEDPNPFIADVAKVLHEDGLFVAQLMCLKNMLDMRDVGNLAHEHLEFYSIRSLDYLLGKHGLAMFGVQTNDVNGQSYRLFCCHANRVEDFKKRCDLDSPEYYRGLEAGLDDPNFYSDWFDELEANRNDCRNFIFDEVKKGKRVWVYGASTKGNTILQYYDLDSSVIEGAADRSPSKWGKVTVGTGIPIHSEEHAREQRPDYFLALPYAFINQFVKREHAFMERGGRFIVPLPQFGVI